MNFNIVILSFIIVLFPMTIIIIIIITHIIAVNRDPHLCSGCRQTSPLSLLCFLRPLEAGVKMLLQNLYSPSIQSLPLSGLLTSARTCGAVIFNVNFNNNSNKKGRQNMDLCILSNSNKPFVFFP